MALLHWPEPDNLPASACWARLTRLGASSQRQWDPHSPQGGCEEHSGSVRTLRSLADRTYRARVASVRRHRPAVVRAPMDSADRTRSIPSTAAPASPAYSPSTLLVS